jgi:hypothetical protein
MALKPRISTFWKGRDGNKVRGLERGLIANLRASSVGRVYGKVVFHLLSLSEAKVAGNGKSSIKNFLSHIWLF